jgi:hypothetical protein
MPTREPITPDEAFDGLPPEVRGAIEGSGWQEKLRRAASARRLRVDQGSALEDETLRLMSGHQTVEEYAVHLAQELKLPEAELKALAEEIDREIFQPIQKKLQALEPQGEDADAPVAASVGEGEEDDLEALLNKDDEALAKAAAIAPKPLASFAAPAQTPATPSFSAATPVAITPVPTPAPVAPAVPVPAAPVSTQPAALSGAAEKLAGPVTNSAEVIAANLQRPPEPPKPAGHDPYREPVA